MSQTVILSDLDEAQLQAVFDDASAYYLDRDDVGTLEELLRA